MSRTEFNPSLVRVTVAAVYLPSHSSPDRNQYTFAYTITINNGATLPVQLLSRHWIITDAHGEEEEVRGPGVVGAHPELEPGEQFEYTSFCPLETSFGSMRGTYQMVTRTGEPFDVEIAAFALVEPYSVN